MAKLTDFGLARGATDVRLSTSGAPLGSPWYMSPEQVKGSRRQLDARTDIYAMGAVLHEMLTGGKLFEAEGAFAVMRAHVEAEPHPPSSRNPKVPAALDEIVRKAVAKDPAMRFQIGGRIPAGVAACGAGRTSDGGAGERSGSGECSDRFAGSDSADARFSPFARRHPDGAFAHVDAGRFLCDAIASGGGACADRGE